jgi:hypothetical protein
MFDLYLYLLPQVGNFIPQFQYFIHLYIYKNVLSVCVRVPANLRKCFTDGVGIWTQRCRRIRACLGLTFIYIYKCTVRLCACVLVPANLRKCFTDVVGIWTQRCRRIRAWLGLTFIYILYIYIYIYEKNMLLSFGGHEMAQGVNVVAGRAHRGR